MSALWGTGWVRLGASKRECCLAPGQEFALEPEVGPEVGQAGRREVMCMFQWYAHEVASILTGCEWFRATKRSVVA